MDLRWRTCDRELPPCGKYVYLIETAGRITLVKRNWRNKWYYKSGLDCIIVTHYDKWRYLSKEEEKIEGLNK